MSDWIEEEFEHSKREKDQKQREQQLIEYSNYWANLREQIRVDIEQINKLWNATITIENTAEGYRITKTDSFPAIYIDISNGGDNVSIQTEIAENSEDENTTNEDFIVISNNRRIYLKNGFTELLVPEQVSRHILRPIIQVLRTGKEG